MAYMSLHVNRSEDRKGLLSTAGSPCPQCKASSRALHGPIQQL